MKKYQHQAMILAVLPLFAFQCGEWTKYAQHMETKVTPNVIELATDTISFQIHIAPTLHNAKETEIATLKLYALSDVSEELISTIDSLPPKPVQMFITKVVNTKHKLRHLALQLERRRNGKSVASPTLTIATIRDLR